MDEAPSPQKNLVADSDHSTYNQNTNAISNISQVNVNQSTELELDQRKESKDNRLYQTFEFIKNESNFQTIELEFKTQFDLSFQINQEETVLYDSDNQVLLKIITGHKNSQSKILRTIIQKISYEEIFAKVFPNQVEFYKKQIQKLVSQKIHALLKGSQSRLKGSKTNGIQEIGSHDSDSGSDSSSSEDSEEDEQIDSQEAIHHEKIGEITVVVCSQDKSKVLLGNSKGRTFILDVKNFEFLGSFKKFDQKIQYLTGNKDIVVSVNENNQVMLFDENKQAAQIKNQGEDFNQICNIKVSPESNHIVIQEDKEIFVFKYLGAAQYDKNQSDRFFDFKPISGERQISHSANHVLEFTSECFFLQTDYKIDIFKFKEKTWRCQDFFGEANKVKIKMIKLTPDKNHYFVLGIKDTDIKTCIIDSKDFKVIKIKQKKQDFFAIFQEDKNTVRLVTQNGLVLLKHNLETEICEINQLVQEDQELIYFFDKINKKVKFIQICDRSLKIQKLNHPLLLNSKTNQMVISEQDTINESLKKTRIVNVIDYLTQNLNSKKSKSQQEEKQYEIEEQYKIFAISKEGDYFYGQNKEGDKCQINSKNFDSEVLIKGNTIHQGLQIDNTGQFLYYKQGKQINKLTKGENLEVNFETIIEVEEKYIYDWKLTFQNEFLIAVSETSFYKYDLKKKEKIKYFIYEENGQLMFSDKVKDQGANGIILQNINVSPDDKYFTLSAENNNAVWIIELSNMKQKHKIEVFSEQDKQMNPKIRCHFEQQNDKLTQALTIVKSDTKTTITGWDVTNIKSWQRLFIVKSQSIEPINGYNSQLMGLLIDQKVRLWSQVFDEYTSNESESLSEEYYISGPRNMIFSLILKQFCESDNDEQYQKQLIPYLINNLVVPFRYSFLSYLAFKNKQTLIMEALKIEKLKFVRDINGFHVLHYTIMKRNFQLTSDLMRYIRKKPALVQQLKSQDITELLRFGPAFLDKFFNHCIKVLDNQQCQKKDDDEQTYLLENGFQIQKFENLKKNLTNENKGDQDKRPAELKMILIPFNLEKGSNDSLELMKAIELCDKPEVFLTEFLRNIIKYKWQQIESINYISNFVQFSQILLIFYHTYHPSWYWLYLALIMSGLKHLFTEFILFVRLGLNQRKDKNDGLLHRSFKALRFNSYSTIILGLLLTIYSFLNLYAFNQYYSARLLTFITIMSWLKMIRGLEAFTLVREFNLKFNESLNQSAGFMAYFILMFLTLTMTRTVMDKTLEREQGIEKLIEEYHLDFNPSITYLSSKNVYTNQTDDLETFGTMMFDVIGSMVRGDFDDKDNKGIYFRLVGISIVFLTNIFLLNLLIAIMSDGYNKVTTNLDEQLLMRENQIILKLEAIYSTLQLTTHSEEFKNLFWIDYVTQNTGEWRNQTFAITENIKKVFNQIFQQDQKIKKKLAEDQKTEMENENNEIKKENNEIKKEIYQIKEVLILFQENQKIIQQKIEIQQTEIKKENNEIKKALHFILEELKNNSANSRDLTN